MARMLGRTYRSFCGCCDDLAVPSKKDRQGIRMRKRRERNEWRKNL